MSKGERIKQFLSDAVKKYYKDVIFAVIYASVLAILFVSAANLACIILQKSFVMSGAYIVLAAAMYGFCLISKNKILWLIKWGLSVALSELVFKYFSATHYMTRALGWLSLNSGSYRADGVLVDLSGFISGSIMLHITIFCAFTGFMAMFIEPKNFAKFGKVQFIIAAAYIVITIAVVLMLERQFPPYEYIEAYINS